MNAYKVLGNHMCEVLYNETLPWVRPYFAYNHKVDQIPDNMKLGCERASSGSPDGLSISALHFAGRMANVPSELSGAFLFGDYALQCVWAMPLDANGNPDATRIITLVSGHEHDTMP
jgi:hypothetical protein